MSIKSGLNVNKYDTVWETICRRVSFLRAIALSSLGTRPPGNKRLLQLVMQLLPLGYPVTKLPKKKKSQQGYFSFQKVILLRHLVMWQTPHLINFMYSFTMCPFCYVLLAFYPWTCTCLKEANIHVAVPCIHEGLAPGPTDTKVQEMLKLCIKWGQYLAITYTHPPIYLKSFLGWLTATGIQC